MQEILRAPAALLPAVGPDDTRQAATPQADQRAERLTDRTVAGALLRKRAAPVPGNVEKLGQQAHRDSGSTVKVFFSGRRKRSPRATFLVSEETRLSRSTVTPKWA